MVLVHAVVFLRTHSRVIFLSTRSAIFAKGNSEHYKFSFLFYTLLRIGFIGDVISCYTALQVQRARCRYNIISFRHALITAKNIGETYLRAEKSIIHEQITRFKLWWYCIVIILCALVYHIPLHRS